MSQYPESSSKRIMPVLLGASIFGAGLMSLAVAIRAHEQSVSKSLPSEQSTQTAATPVAQTASPGSIASSSPATPNRSQSGQASNLPVSNSSTAQADPQAIDPAQPADLPRIGIVKEMVSGDLMCYLTVQEDSGVTRQVGATFEICEQTYFLNQRVKFFYESASVNDCQSAEPCGKSRTVLLVNRMELAEAHSTDPSTPASDRYTMTNGEWTITVGNIQSWSGVNNTGNLSYEGCNTLNECLRIQGGRISCRDGICVMSWQNGDHVYSLESPMGDENTARQTEATTLTVRQGDAVILRASGFRQVENESP